VGDPELKAFLPRLSLRDEQMVSQGMRLVGYLKNAGLSTEASVLWLNTMLCTLRMAERVPSISITQRVKFAEFLNGLADSCRTNADLRRSLAANIGDDRHFLSCHRGLG